MFLSNPHKQCQNIIHQSHHVNDLVPFLHQLPMKTIKSSINEVLNTLDESEIHKILSKIISINDIFSDDVLQHILTFRSFLECKQICKKWSELTIKNINVFHKHSLIGIHSDILNMIHCELEGSIGIIGSHFPPLPSINKISKYNDNVNKYGNLYNNKFDDKYGPFSSFGNAWDCFYDEHGEFTQFRDEIDMDLPYFTTFLLHNGRYCNDEETGVFFPFLNRGKIIGLGDKVIITNESYDIVNEKDEDEDENENNEKDEDENENSLSVNVSESDLNIKFCAYGIDLDDEFIYFKNIIFDANILGYDEYCEIGYLTPSIETKVIFHNCTFKARCGNIPIYTYKQFRGQIIIIGCIFENNDTKVYHKHNLFKNKKDVQIFNSQYTQYPVYQRR